VFLERIVQDSNEHVKGRIAKVVFNLDEVGISVWGEGKTRKVAVPSWMRREMINYRISRKVKRISVIARVSTGGESLNPYLFAAQDSISVREQLKKHGIQLGTDLVMTSNAKPYINTDVVCDDIPIVVDLNHAELWFLDTFNGYIAQLLMSNCSAHITSDLTDRLTEELVRVGTFELSRTQICFSIKFHYLVWECCNAAIAQ
jgi:hypothetical protein